VQFGRVRRRLSRILCKLGFHLWEETVVYFARVRRVCIRPRCFACDELGHDRWLRVYRG